jgi:hypothetical protein
MTGTDRRVLGPVALLALVIAVTAPAAAATQPAQSPGRGTQIAAGGSGALAEGDPLGGAYLSVRLPAEGAWAVGLDGYGEYGEETELGVRTESTYVGAFLAADRDLSDILAPEPRVVLQAGGRAGVVVERDRSAGRERIEPYPSVGAFATAAWYVAPAVALESRLSLDVGAGARLGLGFGVRVGR